MQVHAFRKKLVVVQKELPVSEDGRGQSRRTLLESGEKEGFVLRISEPGRR